MLAGAISVRVHDCGALVDHAGLHLAIHRQRGEEDESLCRPALGRFDQHLCTRDVVAHHPRYVDARRRRGGGRVDHGVKGPGQPHGVQEIAPMPVHARLITQVGQEVRFATMQRYDLVAPARQLPGED